MRYKLLLNNGLIIFIVILPLFTFCVKNDDRIDDNQSPNFITQMDSVEFGMEAILKNEFDLWYPLAIDSVYGGFFSDINYKWELDGQQTKMIVTQARHVWSNANATFYYNDKDRFLNTADHGFHFLKNKMWDSKFGGFFNLVERSGNVIKENGEIIKRAYGNSFAIYGLAAYYKASGNGKALELAIETFDWLEKHSYDPEYGGYFQFMSEKGNAYKDGYGGVAPKDQNTMIHMLECYTELYRVWPNEKLKDRLTELLHLIRDVITTPKGNMNLFFKRDWTPISYRNAEKPVREENYEFDHVSFGHDIETAYLIMEASEVLGIEDDSLTITIAKKMVDHTLLNGWDDKNGGIYDRGYYMPGENKITIIKNTKEWWCQIEALNSSFIMSKLFPDDELDYHFIFLKQWNYINNYLIDKQYGGWYWGGIDIMPENMFLPKGTIWKGNYHTTRGLINCLKNLSKN